VTLVFGLERQNNKRTCTAALAVITLLVGICAVSASPMKLCSGMSRQNIYTFLDTMKMIGGATAWDTLRSRLRIQVLSAPKIYADVSAHPEIYGIPGINLREPADVRSMFQDSEADGADMVSRE